MTKFFFHFTAKTPASVNSRLEQQVRPREMWSFTYGSNTHLKLALTDSVRERDGVQLHQGLDVFVQLVAEESQDAQKEAKGRAEQILSVATLVSQTSCAPSKMMSVIQDIENQPSESRFQNYLFEGKNLVPPIRKLDENTFKVVFGACAQTDDGDRISRAIFWLRKGLEEDYATDAFIAYWVGLEVLSGLLRRKLQMRVKNPQKWDGLKEIVESKTDVSDFDQLKSDRDKLLHGLSPLTTDFVSQIGRYRDDTRKALVYAVCDLLNLPDTVPTQILQNQPMKVSPNISTALCGTIEGIPKTFEELVANYLQTVDFEVEGKTIITESGEIQQSGKYNFRRVGPEGAKWSTIAIEQWGGKDIGIRGMNIRVDEDSGKNGATKTVE